MDYPTLSCLHTLIALFCRKGVSRANLQEQNKGRNYPSTLLMSRAGKALLCPCAISLSASHLVTSKAQTVLSLTLLLGVCPPPRALETFSWAHRRLQPGSWYQCKAVLGELMCHRPAARRCPVPPPSCHTLPHDTALQTLPRATTLLPDSAPCHHPAARHCPVTPPCCQTLPHATSPRTLSHDVHSSWEVC